MYKNLSPQALGLSGRDSETIELALSNGFKGLSLDLADFAEQIKTQGMARAARLLTSSRLKLSSFQLPIRWEDDSPEYKNELTRLGELAEIAKQLGCTRATVTIEPGSDQRPYHQNFEFHRRRLSEIAELLKPFGIRLGVGFLAPTACRLGRAYQFVQSFDEVVMLLQMIGHPQVGLALDTWHWHLGRGRVEQLRALGREKLITVTLADADAGLNAESANLAARKLPGEGGAIDTPAVLAALAEMGYDGPVTPEPDKSQWAGQSRQKFVQSAAAALDRAWKAAGLTPAGKLATVSGR